MGDTCKNIRKICIFKFSTAEDVVPDFHSRNFEEALRRLFFRNKNLRVVQIWDPFYISGNCLRDVPSESIESMSFEIPQYYHKNFLYNLSRALSRTRKPISLELVVRCVLVDTITEISENFSRRLNGLTTLVLHCVKHVDSLDRKLGQLFSNNYGSLKYIELSFSFANAINGECLVSLNSDVVEKIRLDSYLNLKERYFFEIVSKFKKLRVLKFDFIGEYHLNSACALIVSCQSLQELSFSMYDYLDVTLTESLGLLSSLEELSIDGLNDDVVHYFFFETVKKPLRGFSLTTRSAGSSTGVPLAFFSTLAKK